MGIQISTEIYIIKGTSDDLRKFIYSEIREISCAGLSTDICEFFEKVWKPLSVNFKLECFIRKSDYSISMSISVKRGEIFEGSIQGQKLSKFLNATFFKL